MILPSTHFRQVKANPLKMKGHIFGLLTIRALASSFYGSFFYGSILDTSIGIIVEISNKA